MSLVPVTSRTPVPASDAPKLLRQLQRELSQGAISAERAAAWADALAQRVPPRAADADGDRELEQAHRLRSQELFDFAPHPCVSTDLMGIVLEANHAAAELFRTRKEFLTGKPLLLFMCERDRSSYYGLLTRLRRGDGVARGQPARLRPRPNEYAEVLLWASAVADDSGRLIGIRWLFRDVSAVTQAERALREERDFADSLLEAAESVVLVLDEAGRIVRANSYLRRLSGRDDGELVGLAWHALLPEEDAPPARRAVCDALERGTTPTFTTGLTTGSGRLRLIAWSAKAIPRGDGSAAVLVMGQDITDLHEAREQVAQAERLAALGRRMAIQAHESRNLLQRGMACLDRLGWRLAGDAELLDLVGRARAALTALGRLYEDVRTVAGPLPIDRAPCDLRAVWRDAFADIRAVRPGREAELVEDTEGADPRCVADAFRLRQVFRNLFDNSFDACPGAVRVEVRCLETPEGGLEVSVRDNGPGLSAEQRGRLFELFYTTKPRGSGMGMGIAQRSVEAHGGRIVAGDDGPGAEFIITLPREQP